MDSFSICDVNFLFCAFIFARALSILHKEVTFEAFVDKFHTKRIKKVMPGGGLPGLNKSNL